MIIEVQTTQNVTIDYETAGIGFRLLAYILDWLFIIVWYLGWIGLLDVIDISFSNEDGYIILIILMLFPVVFYDLLFEILNNGQSPGKMIMKIRVVNVDGTTPSYSSYLLRWLFRLVDFTMTNALLGVIMIAVTKKSQRLGDYLAGTTVVDLRLNSRNRTLSLSDLDFHSDYKVSYQDILDKLSDKDIQTIRSIIEDHRMQQNIYFTQRLAERIRAITGYTYDGPDTVFLKKIVSDYNYLAVQE